MCSRRKMCAKLFITVEVPAPEDPVTAMTGCLALTARLRLNIEPLVEQRRAIGTIRAAGVLGMIAFDALHLMVRAQDQRNTLVQGFRHDLEQALPSRSGETAGLLNEQGDGVCFVQKGAAAPAG